MNSIKDTIAAPATPVGTGGVAVIRVSGENSKEILKRVFNRNGEFEHAKMYYGKIKDGGEILDEGYAVFFENPKSYTGEDTFELHVHGSRIGILRIMELLLKNGARQAEPGEFSKRAFINGKIDLTKAQAISDYISASARLCLKHSAEQMNGSLKKSIDEYISRLTDIIAEQEAAIEYPDEDFEDGQLISACDEIAQLSQNIRQAAQTYKTGVHIKQGVKTVITGKPNVGKSSLLNALCGKRRAIVSDIAGTTRDVVTEKTEIEGIVFELSDTAGIRESQDTIENMGAELSQDAIKNADLILFMLDCTRPIDDFDLNVLRAVKNSKNDYYIVLNKVDCSERVLNKDDIITLADAPILEVSAFSMSHIQNLKNALKNYALKDYNPDGTVVINLRQAQLLDTAAQCLERAEAAARQGLDCDCVLTDLKEALFALGEITGKSVTEDVVNRVFEKFCLGK